MSATIDYREYINSDAWKERRATALRRSFDGNRYSPRPCCEVCGKHGREYKNPASSLDSRDRHNRVDGANGLEVHHLHYRTLGEESPEDLIVLCTDVCYFDDWDRAYRAARDAGRGREFVLPKRAGCHERTHDDPAFRQKVELLAAQRL